MSAVWAIVRTGLGRRAGTTVVLALLVAVATGTVVASVAGARRTDSAMDRFVQYSRPEDLFVQAPDSATTEKVAALPQVVDHGRSPFLFLTRTRDGADAGTLATFAAADERIFRTMDRVVVVRGRQARIDNPTEVVVNEMTARRLHLGVGSPLTLYAYSLDQIVGSATSGRCPGRAHLRCPGGRRRAGPGRRQHRARRRRELPRSTGGGADPRRSCARTPRPWGRASTICRGWRG